MACVGVGERCLIRRDMRRCLLGEPGGELFDQLRQVVHELLPRPLPSVVECAVRVDARTPRVQYVLATRKELPGQRRDVGHEA